MNPPESLLMIRLKSIGEVVMALSAVEAVHRQWHKTRIGFMVEPPHEQLLEADNRINCVHLFDKRKWRAGGLGAKALGFVRFVGNLRRKRYEAVVDFHGVPRSQLLARLAPGKRRVGRASGKFPDRFMHQLIPAVWDGRHNVDLLYEMMGALGLKTDTPYPTPHIMISPEAHEVAGTLIRSWGFQGRRIIGLHPGTSSHDRVWPPDRFVKLGKLIRQNSDAGICISAGPGEEETAGKIAREIGLDRAKVATLDHLLHFAALIDRFSVLVASDTGPTHMAAATRCPVVGIYGYSDPRRSGPYGPGNFVFYKSLACSPCKSFVFECTHKTCFRLITPTEVFEKVTEVCQTEEKSKPAISEVKI